MVTSAPTRDNVDTVHRAYAAFNAGEIDAALDLGTDDQVHDWSRSIGPYSGVYEGRDSAKRFFKSVLEAVDELSFEIDRAEVIGPHVLAMVRAFIRGRGSGAEATATGPHLWTFEDGKVKRFVLYQEEDEARAAARAAS